MPEQRFGAGGAPLDLGSYFGGAHAGGMQGALADGSVRNFNFSIAEAIFSRLGQKSDGTPVQLDR